MMVVVCTGLGTELETSNDCVRNSLYVNLNFTMTIIVVFIVEYYSAL